MLKSFLLGTILLFPFTLPSIADMPSPVSAQVTSCGHSTPYGVPTSSRTGTTFASVCHAGYLSHYDESAKVPDWVVYFLTPMDSMGCGNRSNAFKRDPSLAANLQASPDDYARSGYDKGHIANDEDMRWDPQVERESFYMTNMTPQKPSFNRGIWKNLEDDVRNWAVTRTHNMLIYAGSIYNNKTDSKIGDDKVDVPTGFYKIVIDDDAKEAIAFKFDDQNTANNDTLESHIVSIDAVEKAAGISFPMPKEISKTSTSKMWDYTKGLYTKEKKQACSSK